jgi:hypothetical protein
MFTPVAVLPALALAASAAAYTWPNRLVDEVEHLLVDNAGYNNAGFGELVCPPSCYVASLTRAPCRRCRHAVLSLRIVASPDHRA